MPYRQLMEDRLRFLDIDHDTISLLRSAREILEPAMGEMLDQFYSHILDEPDLKDLFLDEEVQERARSSQMNHWMEALFSGKYDNAYYEKTSQIGLAHARIGLTPNWYIGGYNQMLGQFIELIETRYAEKNESAAQLIKAVSKIIFLDMDLVIHCYLDAKDSSMRRMLEHATQFKDDMWESSDSLNMLTESIKTTVESLSEKMETQLDSGSSKVGSLKDGGVDIIDQLNELSLLTEQLSSQTAQLDEQLKKQPISDKLYLPEQGVFGRLKEKMFTRKYHHIKARR